MKPTSKIRHKLRKIILLSIPPGFRKRNSQRLRRGTPGAFGKCHNRPEETPRELIEDKFLHSVERKRRLKI